MVGATPAPAAAIVNGCCTLMATNPTGNASSSPVLCASRGRRRPMVPFKTAPFALLLFFSSKTHKMVLF
jgi:hypothetical protein